jgi:hypothetical protein
MASKEKAYVSFDPDSDLHCWNVMKAWNEEGKPAFNFQTGYKIHLLNDGIPEARIKRKIRKSMHGAKVLIVLIGNNTWNLVKYVKWEIEYALENNIPIIGVNLNTRRKQDDLCPPVLRKELVMYIAFGQKIMDIAINNWPESHFIYKNEGKSGPYHYFDSVYATLWKQCA